MKNLVRKTNRKAAVIIALTMLLGGSSFFPAMASDPVTWYSSHEFDSSGYRPRDAFNGQTVVEVHQGGYSGVVPLWYRVGTLDPQTQSTITWGNSAKYDRGSLPSVAINGQTVVEVHAGGSQGVVPLWYRVGVVQGTTIQWGSSHQYDRGANPSIAFANATVNGQTVPAVIEVHQGANRDNVPLWYRIGVVYGSTIRFSNSYEYDRSGSSPMVSFDGTNVLEVHNGQVGANYYSLWYRGGTFNGSSVQWGPSVHFDNGGYPSVAQMFGQVIEVEEQQLSGINPLLFHAGDGPQGSGDYVNFYANGQYDQGMFPSISFFGSAYYGGNMVEVHQGSAGVGPMWYRVGLIQGTQ